MGIIMNHLNIKSGSLILLAGLNHCKPADLDLHSFSKESCLEF